MTMLRLTARILLTFAVLFGVSASARADDSKIENAPSPSNRWAIFIDASNNSNDENEAAFVEFRDALIASGVPEKNVLVYSASSPDPKKRPTRETLDALLKALKQPDKFVLLPGETEERRLRNEVGVCEVQIYLTSLGVSDEATGEAFFAPCDVDESQIDDEKDPRLMSLNAIEDALLFADDGQTPLERAFFVVALNSPKAATRGPNGEISRVLNGVDPKRIPTRGADDENERGTTKFAYFRIATKNARFDDRLVGSFYSTLRDGLKGSADVAGDQNGTVSAEELATYLETTARIAQRTVAVDRSGNVEYPLCDAQIKASIPTELFDELSKTFTNPKFAKEKKDAQARAKKARGQSKTTQATNKKVGTDSKNNASKANGKKQTLKPSKGVVVR